MYNDNLIYDLGCNDGLDSLFFLMKGYDVLGVECSPKLVESLKLKFMNFNNFILIDRCITDTDNSTAKFYLSETRDLWNSCNKDIAERLDSSREIEVRTTTLQRLFDEYGVPKYCKIDIEGNDIIALNSIKDLPKYISCETECIGNTKKSFETAEPLAVLNKLNSLGYTKFKLLRQDVLIQYTSKERILVSRSLPWEYPSDWDNFEDCCNLLLELRSKHNFNNGKYTFWFDVLATTE